MPVWNDSFTLIASMEDWGAGGVGVGGWARGWWVGIEEVWRLEAKPTGLSLMGTRALSCMPGCCQHSGYIAYSCCLWQCRYSPYQTGDRLTGTGGVKPPHHFLQAPTPETP